MIVAFVSPRTTSVIVGALGGPRGTTEFVPADGTEDPAALFATTVNEYEVPFVNPPTVQLVAIAEALQVAPPGDAVTVYPVIGEPPLSVGAVHEISALLFPPDAEAEVGASGIVAGVAVAVTVEDSESPTELVAITRKV